MNTEDLTQRLERLLSEPLQSVRERQAGTLDQRIGGLDRPFVLFGASQLGRKALAVLKELGFVPCAFLDNNPALWGTQIDSVLVLSPAKLAETWEGALPSVICTIWSGHIHDCMSDRLQPLVELGFERIALFGHLAWRFPQYLLPHYCMDLPENVLPEAGAIRKAFALLADETSRKLYVDHVEWRLHLDHDLLPVSSPLQIYFDAHFSTNYAAEVVFDLGAFNGDTLESYLASGRDFLEYHCFEPVTQNFAQLQACVQRVDDVRVQTHRLAIGEGFGDVLIEAANGPSSRVGMGDELVPMTTLDELSARGLLPTFIKIDIEGLEPQCLAGGRAMITEHEPVIAVSVYHEQSHLWQILLQLHSYSKNYRYSLGPHVSDGWDLVLYAVPEHRLPT
ncbi:methyltransferase, FkbM family [Halopseudomonas sabulinigri]|uniref:Methyltransferase, FkbM family n=1 Tax=Halopseudomonas sabulinigri TaxID=472181 RepID=A0A1H1Q4M1_9GAMM|nr:FkbM family methyltransferase [Halopseudomonas sabulinigri]SDS18448.1 methyltransferase, FkbM family [Halopseudomonas sabulinigri]